MPQRITATDHADFARKGFNSVRYRFERAAKAFNREHSHAQITVRRDGADVFTCKAQVEGVARNMARVVLKRESWNQQWTIEYERGSLIGFVPETPHYSTELRVTIAEENNQLHYKLLFLRWDHPIRAPVEPADIANLFWQQFTDPLTRL